MEHPRHGIALAALLLVVPLAVCSTSGTAIDLRLLPNPAINSEAQILALVDTLELVLDASEGFSGVSGTGEAGDFVAEQVDGDAPLELVLRRDLRQATSLPRLRLVPGTNGGRPFKLTARGRKGDDLVAASSAAARFIAGTTTDLVLPFNLRARYRPPRVVITLPHDGERSVPSALDGVYVEFSKLVAEPTVTAHLTLTYQGTAGDRKVETQVTLGRKAVNDLGLAEERSTATLSQFCSLNPGTYRIEAGAAITDPEGRPLDHGSTGYVARFTIDGPAADQPCAQEVQGCTGEGDCNPDPATTDGRKRFYCDFSVQPARCLPLQDNCQAGAPCPIDFPICTEDGNCVASCLDLGGYCNDPNYYCARDGQCLPCDSVQGCDVTTEGYCQQLCADLCVASNEGSRPEECNGCLTTCQDCLPQCQHYCLANSDNTYQFECEDCMRQCYGYDSGVPN